MVVGLRSAVIMTHQQWKWQYPAPDLLQNVSQWQQEAYLLEAYLLEVDPVEMRDMAPSNSGHDELEEVVTKID